MIQGSAFSRHGPRAAEGVGDSITKDLLLIFIEKEQTNIIGWVFCQVLRRKTIKDRGTEIRQEKIIANIKMDLQVYWGGNPLWTSVVQFISKL